jgi:hypothetical protein
VYISTSGNSNRKDLYAMVITNITYPSLSSITNPGIIYERYQRDSATTSKFYRYYANITYKIAPLTIQGSKNDGYYVSNDDYINDTSSTSGYGLVRSLYSSYCISSATATMSEYQPDRWRPFTEDDYIGTWPSELGNIIGSFYHKDNIPTTTVATYGLFSGTLTLDSATGYYLEGSGGSSSVRYTRSGTAPYLYTIFRQFIAPSCNIDLLNPLITSRANGIVYSAVDALSREYAIVITNLPSSLSSTDGDIIYERYQKTNTNYKFHRINATDTFKISSLTIHGPQSSGYYVSNDDYTSTFSSVSDTTYTYGPSRALSFVAFMPAYSSTSNNPQYQPGNWKTWDSQTVQDNFIATWPSKFSTSITKFYHKDNIPTTPTVNEYGLFSETLELDSATGYYKEGSGGNSSLYARSGDDPNWLYTKQ